MINRKVPTVGTGPRGGRTIPPDRGDNPLKALDLLEAGEFVLFRMNWYIKPASENSKLLRELFWKIEELQKALEDEIQVACKRTLKKVTEE